MSQDNAAHPRANCLSVQAAILLVACLYATSMPALATVSRAGPDQTVQPSAVVTLDGSQSTAGDGGALTYSWSQIAGPSVTLSNPAGAVTQFTSPVAIAEWVILTFELRATDSLGAADVDTVTTIVSESLVPRNRVKIVSPPGDIVGQGSSFETSVDPASFSISSNPGNFFAQILIGNLPLGGTSTSLSVTLARADERPLSVGQYELAYRNGNLAGQASLSARRGIFCTLTVGNFIIHDIGFDDAGAITRLAVDLRQFCLHAANPQLPFTAYIRFNSVVPVLSRRPIVSAGRDQVVIPGQSVSVSSDTSWTGAHAVQSYRWRQLSGPPLPGLATDSPAIAFEAPDVPPSGTTFEFELEITNTAGTAVIDRVSVHVQGAAERKNFVYFEVEDAGIGDFVFGTGAHLFDTNAGALRMWSDASGGPPRGFILNIFQLENWDISFFLPPGEQLLPGDVPDIEPPGPADDHPRLSVSGRGRGYNRTYGFAVIHDVEFAADGTISSLAMDFNYRGDGGPRVSGIVRINSQVPFVSAVSIASAGPDQPAVGGDYVRMGPEASYVGTAPIVEMSWAQISGPAVQLSTVDGRVVHFTAPPEGGVFEFELTIRTSDGRISTSRVTITVAPSGTLRSVLVVSGDPGEPLTRDEFIFAPLAEQSFTSLGTHGFDVRPGGGATAPHQAHLLAVAPRPAPLTLGTLVPGTYENARYYRQRHDIENRPALSFGVNRLECLRPRGRFVVHELMLNQFTIVKLAIDIQQTCDPTGLYLRAQLRLNSAVPVRSSTPIATAGQDLVVRGGSEFLLDGLGSGSWSDLQPTYDWRQVSGTSVNVPQPGSRSALASAAAFATGQATATMELEVADMTGSRSTDRVDITVLGADQPSTEIDVARIRTIDGTVVERLRHDTNRDYITTGESGLRQRFVHSVSEHMLSLAIRANLEDEIPTGQMKVTNGSASDFGTPATQIELFEIDEFNDFMSCDTPNGAMRLAEAEFTQSAFSSLAVDLELQCPDGWTYRGVMRFNSAVPIETGRVFAYAGPDREVGEGSTIILDGTSSLVVHGSIAAYRWRQLSGPPILLTNVSPGVASFAIPFLFADVDLQFELEVTGSQGERGTDTVTFHAEDLTPAPPPPPPGGSGGGGGGGGAIPFWLLAILSLGLFPAESLRRRYASFIG